MPPARFLPGWGHRLFCARKLCYSESMNLKDNGHALLAVGLSALAAGLASAAISFPQYAAFLGPFAAALLAASGRTTQLARNAEPPAAPETK